MSLNLPVFWEAVSFNPEEDRGFIVRPHLPDGTGWGSPYVDDDGNRLVPGTLGSFVNDSTFLSIKGGVYGDFRSENLQSAGNIDWKGPWVDENNTKRMVITVNGPQQRYWNYGGFEYGNEDNHSYIYSGGKVIGVAPWPVLGAAMTLVDDVPWLLAMCYVDNSYEALHANVVFISANEDALTEEDVLEYQRYREEGAEGWFVIGVAPVYTDSMPSVVPEAPWFFSENGRQLRTMRRSEISHTELDDSGFYDDELYREIRGAINDEGQTTFDLPDIELIINDNNDGQKWVTTITNQNLESIYTQPAELALDGNEHLFQENWLWAKKSMLGKSKVAVDFKVDTGQWVYAWIEGEYEIVRGQMFSLGVDAPGAPGSNEDSEIGPNWLPNAGDGLIDGDGTPTTQELFDHWPTPGKMNLKSQMVLNIGVSSLTNDGTYGELYLSYGKSAPQSVYSGDESVAGGGNFLAFVSRSNTYLQYTDIRDGLMCARTEAAEAQTTIKQDLSWEIDDANVQWAGVIDDYTYFALEEDDHETFMYQLEPRYNKPKGTETLVSDVLDTVPIPLVDEASEYFSYSAAVSSWNDDGSYFEPSIDRFMHSWFRSEELVYWRPFTIVETLRSPKCAITGVFGTTEKQEHLVAIEFFNPVLQDVVSLTVSWGVGGDPLEVVGADRISPGGLF